MVKTADDVMEAAQLAAILEVSATPKPGNVHRGADHLPTRFEHFLAGSVAIGTSMREAARRGQRAAAGRMRYSQIGIGNLTKKAVFDVKASHSGGNSHLGICMLFTPLAAASGALIGQGNEVKPDELRLQTAKIIEATTVEDAIETHRAVSTLDPGWLGRVRLDGIPDLASDEGVDQISKKGVTLYQMMKAAAEWDGIASEISRSLPAAFKIGYPVFTEVYLQTSDVNTATVNAYLKLLSQVPDTFVARKVGLSQTDSISEAVRIGTSESRRIAREAEKILESYGGMRTEEGRREIQILDQELQTLGRNPGTTADITAASLFIALLCGFRL